MDSIPSQIVADFYEASLDPARWPQALLALGDWVKADAAALAVHDFEQGSGRFERALGLSAEAQISYQRVHARSNVWMQAEGPFRRAPAALRGADLLEEDAVRASSFYRNWLKPAGLLHHLFVVLDRSGSGMTYLVLARREGRPDFAPTVVGELEGVLPALTRAFRAGPNVRRLRALERAALRAVDAMPIGVAVLDANGGIVEANRTARAVIESGEGLVFSNGGLATEVAGRRVKMRDLMARSGERGALPSEEPSMLPVPRASGQRPLTLLLMPLDALPEEVAGNGRPGPAALLFIGDPERSVRFDQTRIARLYGLSRAESRVAALLASGYRLEQVAETLDIAYETVRKHLKQIFGKTGTYRQAELVRMLVCGPAGLAL